MSKKRKTDFLELLEEYVDTYFFLSTAVTYIVTGLFVVLALVYHSTVFWCLVSTAIIFLLLQYIARSLVQELEQEKVLIGAIVFVLIITFVCIL